MSTDEVIELQKQLTEMGFGNLEPDGQFGPDTKQALENYEIYLRELPLDSKPWWTSRTMKSTITVIAGGMAMFIPFLQEVDTKQLVDIIFNMGQHIDIIIQMVGSILAMFGVGGMALGRINATQPIDKTKVLPNVVLRAKSNAKMADVDKWLGRK